MECDVCNLPGTKDTIFPCDGCKKKCCKNCSKLTASEIKVMQLKERIMKFCCKQCRQFETHSLLLGTIEDKSSIIKGKDEIISMLKQKIKELEKMQSHSSFVSFSEVTQRTSVSPLTPKIPFPTNNIPSIVVKPKNRQNIEVTKSEVQQINLEELQIGVKNKRTTKNGSMIIKCENKEEVAILKEKMKNSLQNYDIELTKMKNPRFKIPGYTGIINRQNIETNIRDQNKFIDENDFLKITYIKEIKSKKTNTLFGECSPNLFHKLMSNKKVYIGWERCAVYEDISIQRCFQCQEHFHKMENCQNKMVCEYCSEEHPSKDCPKVRKKCNNCLNANLKYKLNHNVEHEASDLKCPSYQYFLTILRSKIDYGTY